MLNFKPVIVESPYAGDIERNKLYLEQCMRDCLLNHNEAPYASHKLYTDVLDDDINNERDVGIQAGFAWGKFAHACIVYVDFGISEGMQLGIDNAKKNGIPVIMRKLL